METREHAENLIFYFEARLNDDNSEVWEKGASTAKEWLRLINADQISQAEISAFIGIVHANRYWSSAWYDLALGVYHWVSEKGFPLPPRKEFFASEGLQASDLPNLSSLEHALTLGKTFKKYSSEDPDSKSWAVGINIIHSWIILIEKREKIVAEISDLINRSFNAQNGSKIWYSTILAMSLWCKGLGYLELVPENYRDLVSIMDVPPEK